MGDEHTVICLRALVQRYLASNIIEAAKFYAERLFYESPTDESLYLLALCHFRGGKYKQAYLILQHCKSSPQCKYLYALCCDRLDKWEEGERMLRPQGQVNTGKISVDSVTSTPGGAEGVYLLGRFCRKQHRKEMAIAYYKLSLQLDPYLWCSITELSDMGVAVNMSDLLGLAGGAAAHGSHGGIAGKVLRSTDPLNPSAGWLQEAKEASAEQCYSTHNVFRDSQHVSRHRAAEHLASGQQAGTGAAPGKVSMALGLSSMSMHVPFASPGSMPSPLLATAQSAFGADISGFNSTGLASGGLKSVALNSTQGYSGARSAEDSGRRSEFSHAHLHDTRAALFGMGTPGLTPMQHQQSLSTGGMQHAMRGSVAPYTGDSDASAIRGVHLFGGDSAPNSHAVGAGAGTGGDGGRGGGVSHGRRVSFGPTARLSFSGALDAAAHGHHPSSFDDGPSDFNLNTSGISAASSHLEAVDEAEGDEYPFKAPRAEPHANSPSSTGHRSAEASSSRALPHKMMLSPFPVESSPIPQQHGEGLVGEGAGSTSLLGEPFPSPTAASRRKYAAPGRGTPSAATNSASIADQQDKENGPAGAAHRRDGGPSAGIAGVDDTFLGSSPTGSGAGSGSASQVGGEHHGGADPRKLNHLVVTFARAYQMLSTYCCRACIDELQSQLPDRHFRSGLVSQWIGKAFYEMNEYKSAMLAFREMLRVEPFRLCGLETLSTALWHLKRDKELSALAQQVVEVDKLSPEAWCVVGNCFSLQREPDVAIKFFTRALQLDPTFAYAYTLCGHEQVNNEDLEKAVESFRLAILHNDRHYNAWYGLGSIYYRQEKYELAEHHFRTALSINPASSVLHCYLGETILCSRETALFSTVN